MSFYNYALLSKGGSEAITKEITATTYTLQLEDVGSTIIGNNGTSLTITIDTDLNTGWEDKNYVIDFIRYGSGTMEIVAGAGVTLRSASGTGAIQSQYSVAAIMRLGPDEWIILGDIEIA